MAKIFAHRSVLGFSAIVPDSLSENGYSLSEAVINDLEKPGQLGVVCDASKCEISKEAVGLLKQISKSGDCIGDADVFKTDDGMVVISWLGPVMNMIDSADPDISGSSTYDPSLLDSMTLVPNDPPKEFVEAVENHLSSK